MHALVDGGFEHVAAGGDEEVARLRGGGVGGAEGDGILVGGVEPLNVILGGGCFCCVGSVGGGWHCGIGVRVRVGVAGGGNGCRRGITRSRRSSRRSRGRRRRQMRRYAIQHSVLNIRIQREKNDGINRGAELHAKGGKVARVEVEGVAGQDVDISRVRAADVQEGLVLRCWWTSGLYGEGFGLAQGDGWDAGGDMRFDALGVAGVAAETGDFACYTISQGQSQTWTKGAYNCTG